MHCIQKQCLLRTPFLNCRILFLTTCTCNSSNSKLVHHGKRGVSRGVVQWYIHVRGMHTHHVGYVCFNCLNYCIYCIYGITVCLYLFAAKGVVIQWYIYTCTWNAYPSCGVRFTCLNYCIYCITVCLYLFVAKGVVVQWYIHVHGMHTHHVGFASLASITAFTALLCVYTFSQLRELWFKGIYMYVECIPIMWDSLHLLHLLHLLHYCVFIRVRS